MNEADRAAKLTSITAFFDDLEERLDFVGALNEGDRQNEAFTLCTAYIDALGLAFYWPDERSYRCFVRVLREFGGKAVLDRFHVTALSAALETMDRPKAKQVLDVLGSFSESYTTVLLTEDDLINMLRPQLDSDLMTWFRNEMWRGTLAALVYREMRVPSVHSFGAMPMVFSETTMNSEPVPSIDLNLLLACARRIAAEARVQSESSVRWFGHDFRHKDQPTLDHHA